MVDGNEIVSSSTNSLNQMKGQAYEFYRIQTLFLQGR